MSDKENKENKDQLYYTIGTDKISEHMLPDECSTVRGLPFSSSASTDSSRLKLKSGFNRYDTDAQRPEDRIPTTHKDIIRACQGIYKKIGFVKNIIDLMSDFASEGLELQHPDRKQQTFFREWAKRVNLEARAHDFMKLLLRDANVIVRRKTAFLTKPLLNQMSAGAYDEVNTETVDETKVNERPEKIKPEKINILKREVPWRYTFISPTMVEKTGGELGKFFGSQSVAMRLSPELIKSINNPRTKAEKDFIDKLPAEVIKAARDSESHLVALDPDKVYIDYYKKDDWEEWGTPFLYGILEDIIFKDKMKQADMAALDGVINTVRLWKLGNSSLKILPSKNAVNKLLGILQHNVGGGIMDIVWDDMIDFKVEYPPTDKILGAEKYKSVNRDILLGLGVPEALLGSSETNPGAQTAFVQLKTLVERLEYIRSRCITWIENELKIVTKAMGFKKIPNIMFGTMSLRDESVEKQLLIQLLDRGIISMESVLSVFGQDFTIELERMREEQDLRTAEKPVLEKANPYYRPNSVMQFERDTQVKLQNLKNGVPAVAPINPINQTNPTNLPGPTNKKSPIVNPGRPPNTKDTKQRKIRSPKVLSVLKAIAENYLNEIDKIIDPLFLEQNKCKNLRSLTKSKKDILNLIKFNILSCVSINTKINKDIIEEIVNGNFNSKINDFYNIFNEFNNEYLNYTKQEPGINEKRSFAASSWAILIEDDSLV